MCDREKLNAIDTAEFDWTFGCCGREGKIYKSTDDDPLAQICNECKRELRNAKWGKILREAIC